MKPKSLFWTFAGVFLLVVALATAAQVAIGLGVLRPLQQNSLKAQAASALYRAAGQIAELEGEDGREIMRALHENRVPGNSLMLVFLGNDGRLVPERPIPPGMMPQVRQLAANAKLPGAFSRPPREQRPPRFDDGPLRDEGPPPDRPEGPPPDGGEGPPLTPRDRRLELVDHVPATVGDRAIGSLLAIGDTSAGSVDARRWLLFFPLSVLAAAVAGLWLARMMVRRLGALEAVAMRVASGDLDARVATTGADEIGRLEQRFNRMTEGLAAARREVEATDAQRRQLFADITHELATPLTTIRGSIETLLDPHVATSEAERRAYLDDVLGESKRLDLLVQDLMELARLESRAQALKPVRLDWAALCRNTARRLEPRFRAAGLTLRWNGDEREAWIVADGRRMEQVVENLLVNALRYVPSGGTVSLEVTDGRLTVRDDGPGIAPDSLSYLFDRFYRARAARDDGGSGLGLAIVKEIVAQHRGRVWAESEPGHGATFVVELPGVE
jgi:signal transduction histidine kinase